MHHQIGPSRRWLASVVALALALAGVVATGTTATAAPTPNPDIVVSDVTLTTSDGGPATIGDVLTVAGTWDATTANPQAGDTFTIGLPSELGFTQPVPFDLLGGGGVVWGSCLTDPATDLATCELTDAVTSAPELVKGTFEFEVEAVLATVEEDVEFSLNGKPVRVDLPGTGGIDDGIVISDEWTKTGALQANKWSMRWTIELPGSRLAGHDVVNVAERLGSNHVLCENPNLVVETVRGGTVVNVTSIAEITAPGAPAAFGIRLTAPSGGFDRNVTYRLRYTTCTPDGQIDPVGTTYTNEAEVDVWGESSGVVGVTQDWSFTAVVDKSGSVLGGAQRNGVIQWTVTVAGDHLLGKDGFTLEDTLTGAHAVCRDADGDPEIRGLRVEERYGPSGDRTRVIGTDLLGRTVTAADDTSFAVDFSTLGDFAFQPSAYLYRIQYQTCATTDGLPTAGTAFGNTAAVDGVLKTAGTTAPGRSEGKAGRINTTSVELDGTTYLPQTTLGWTVTVPGQELAAIQTPLTLTDTLTAAHQVCGDGDDVAARLGLRVQARDQIQNGGLATVDLTDAVDASVDDAGVVTLVIPVPTLPLPGGGTAVGFSREYQYVVDYTTCTTTGGMDSPGTEYGNTAEVAGKSFSQRVVQQNRGSGTGEGVTRGSIAVTKRLAGTPGAALVPSGTAFTVHVKEIDPAGVAQLEYDLAVPADGAPVSGPNSRGTGWTVELSEPTFPTVPGVAFGAPRFAEGAGVTLGADGTTAVVALTPGSNVAVELTNTALLGSVELLKAVEGPAADLAGEDRRYAVTAQIDTSALGDTVPAQADRTVQLTAGEPLLLADLPIGATVTFSEALPLDDDTLTWSPVEITPNSLTVTAAHSATPAAVAVTNEVHRSVGSIVLSKVVTGDQAGNAAVPDAVTVTASWDSEGTPGSTVLDLPTDGTPVGLGVDLLVGTQVRLSETGLEDGSSIAWGAPVWSGVGVTVDGTDALVRVGRGEPALVTLENHAATSTAGLSLLKGLAGEAAGEVDPDTEFGVTVTWRDADDVEQSRDLTINAVEPTPLGEDLPAGTVVTVTEGERPGIDTVVWDTITISGTGVSDAGDGSATVVVSDLQGATTLVTVTNEATWAPGTFDLSKQVEGVLLDHPDVPGSVTVVATWWETEGWDEPVERSVELEVPTDGTRVELGLDLPHGTEVRLSEAALSQSAAFTWALPTWAGDAVATAGDGEAVVTIGAATTAEVELTNTAVASTGTLGLAKQVTGDGGDRLAPGTAFGITLAWTDLLGEDRRTDVEVRPGEVTRVPEVPLGTEVRVVEASSDLPGPLLWRGVTWTGGEGVELAEADGREVALVAGGEPGAVFSLTAVNDIVVVPGLPAAGAGTDGRMLAGLVLAALVSIAGGAWLVVSRNRRRA